MRARSIPLALILALLLGLLTPAPASATFSFGISFLHSSDDLYSPFGGPARIKFNYAGSDPNVTFSVRIRPLGGAAVHEQSFFIETPTTGSTTRNFEWPAISVKQETPYQIVIYRGSKLEKKRDFTIQPPLVRITSIRPDPFYPWILDGYRDTTEVTFRLAASSEPVFVKVYRADGDGRCCGTLIETHNLETEVVGERHDEWDGRDGGGDPFPKGDYFVRVTATVPSVPEYVTRTSRPVEVSIARLRKVFKDAVKNGIAYHHRGPIVRHRDDGSCGLAKDAAAKDLLIRCRDASVRVFWRWNLPDSGEIEKVSFGLIKVPGYVCGATKGHTAIDSFLKVGGLGQFRCRVDKAGITYSFLKPS